MHVLWEHGQSTVAEVHARLGKEFAYMTVLNVLRTLESKGAVTRTKEGRAHRYAARIPRSLARQRALAALAVKFFRGSTEAEKWADRGAEFASGKPSAGITVLINSDGPAPSGQDRKSSHITAHPGSRHWRYPKALSLHIPRAARCIPTARERSRCM